MRKVVYSMCFALLGIISPQLGWAEDVVTEDNVPKADLLDVVFNSDGTATDVSPMQNPIEVFGMTSSDVSYSEKYKRNVAYFANPISGTATLFYKVDYADNQAFRDAIADGHSMEMLVSADFTGSLPAAKECKPFTSHQTGGTGLMICKAARSNNGTSDFTFLPYVGGDYKYALSGISPRPKIYYHVVGVWNKEEGKAYIYVDGELKGSVDAAGDYSFPKAGSNWFGIGADPSGETKANTAWCGEVALARIYDAPLTAEQVAALYAQVNVGKDYGQMLQNTVDSLATVSTDYAVGNYPGYIKEDVLAQYQGAYNEMLQNAQNALTNGATDEEYNTLRINLINSYKAIGQQYNPMVAGYYNFVNDYSAYEETQGVKKAMSATKGQLTWKTYDPKDPTQLFKVTDLGDGTYSIQNVATGEYINTIEGQSALVPMTAEQTTPQTFTHISESVVWNIANTANTMAYHTEGHLSGLGISGNIVTWDGGAGSASAWHLYTVSDQALIDSLTEVGPKQVLATQLEEALASAQTMKEKVYDYTALITKSTQLSTNSLQYKYPPANLIDGNTATVFHTLWDSGTMKSETGEGTGYHNLQVALDEPVNELFFRFTGLSGTTYHDTPNNIGIYVTNDDALGASTLAADSTQWVHVTDLTSGFPEDVEGAKYTSPTLKFDDSYKYIRLVVRHTTHQGRVAERTFMNPYSTGVTFNLSEFQMYKPGYTATSEYETVEGMKAAVDNLSTLIDAAQEKVNNLTATETDIETLNAAVEAVKALYINRDSLYTELASTLASAQKVYNQAMGSKEELLTDASQLSTNSSSSSDHSSLEHLLDDNTHYNYNFHSVWLSAQMTNADITAEEWEAALASSGKTYVGHGYHNLQVKLNNPVSNFWFEYIARTSTTYVDNPTDIQVYVTNDDALGASADQADIDQWTFLTELTEGFPQAEAGAKYTSPVLQLEDGSTFKYVRFVIKNSALVGKVRTFANPDVTGITWNVATWRMFGGLDPQHVQYNYNEDMRNAVDALKALIDEATSLQKENILTNEKQIALNAAADLVLSQYADTTEFAQLYKSYKELADNSEVDVDKAVGYVDSQEAIDVFETALSEAKADVDPIQPYKVKVEAAVASMKAAYKEFISHVGKVEADKWYFLRSATAEGDESATTIFPGRSVNGTALYITSDGSGWGSVEGDYHAGEQLRWGMEDLKGKSTEVDADAMWRFIAVPEEEYGANVYYIQNLHNASYIGTANAASDAYVKSSSTPVPFRLDPAGKGQFNIVAICDPINAVPISAGDNARQIRCDVFNTTGINLRTSWTIEPVAGATDCFTMSYPNNSIQVVTLPFAVSGLNPINDVEVHTYAIHSLKSETELALVEKSDFAAGEPFVMSVGDVSVASAEDGKTEVLFPMPESFEAKADTVNGLAGVLNEKLTISKSGYGYIENSVLKVLSNEGSYEVGALSGYVIPSMIAAQEGDYTKILTTEGALGLKLVNTDANAGNVNVYTVDGKLIKRNVKTSDAQKNLKKGIYIIGKQKVAVK